MDGRPALGLIKNPEDAETMARDWMVYFGFSGARLTPRGTDGGVDVRSGDAVAQVKAEMKPIGRPPVQQLNGIAAHESKVGVFFSLSGYTTEAKSWANAAGIALFEFDYSGGVSPANNAARKMLEQADAEAALSRPSIHPPFASPYSLVSLVESLMVSAQAVLTSQQAKLITTDDHWGVTLETREKIGPIISQIEELLGTADPSAEVEELRSTVKVIADSVRTLGVKTTKHPVPDDESDEEVTAWFLQEFIADTKPLLITASTDEGGQDDEVWRVIFDGGESHRIVIEMLIPPDMADSLGSEWHLGESFADRLRVRASVPRVGDSMSQAQEAITILFSGLRSIGYGDEMNLTQSYGLPSGAPFSGPLDVPSSVMRRLEGA